MISEGGDDFTVAVVSLVGLCWGVFSYTDVASSIRSYIAESVSNHVDPITCPGRPQGRRYSQSFSGRFFRGVTH